MQKQKFIKLDWNFLDRKSAGEPFYFGTKNEDDCVVESHIVESSAGELCWDLTIRNIKTGFWLSRGGVAKSIEDCKSIAQRASNVLWKSRNDTAW